MKASKVSTHVINQVNYLSSWRETRFNEAVEIMQVDKAGHTAIVKNALLFF